LMTSAAYTKLGTLDCSNRKIKDLSGIEYFQNIRVINCSNNQITYIPSLAGFTDSLQEFHCSDNLLTELPDFKTGSPLLKVIFCNNNLLTIIPSFADLVNLDSLECINNHLTFEDLINVTAPNLTDFLYWPQHPVQIPSRVELIEGDSYVFSFPQDTNVNSNKYKLFRNGILLANLDSLSTFMLNNVNTSNSGRYTWQVTNQFFPNLILTSTELELVLANRSNKIFTPDGDNINDSYYIPCNGVIRIYNKLGKVVKELHETEYWDGTDQHGKYVQSGAYILRCGDRIINSVTIIR
jgi:Leucine-rich repeat (LRR) protein